MAPSSRYQEHHGTDEETTLAVWCRAQEKRSGPSGSPCCTPDSERRTRDWQYREECEPYIEETQGTDSGQVEMADWRTADLLTLLKALLRSTVSTAQSVAPCAMSEWMPCCRAIGAKIDPFGVATPHWSGRREWTADRTEGWVSKTLEKRRRRVSPTAMGLVPRGAVLRGSLFFFSKAMSFPEAQMWRSASWVPTARNLVVNVSSSLRHEDACSGGAVMRISKRC